MQRTHPSRTFFAVTALLAAAGGSAEAQTIRGLLVEQDTHEPIAGAMVWLMSGESRLLAALTDSVGRFFLRAPHPGRYTARAERIGYEDAVSRAVELVGLEFVDLRILASQRPVTLNALVVEGEQRCRVRPAEGLQSAQLWREARKALEAAQWTRDRALYRYDVVEHERELTPSSLRIVKEQLRARSVVGREPIRSIPATRLDREGYIHEDGGGHIYYAPDAQVLLSDVFLDSHCFRAQAGARGRAGLIGLAFQPIPGRRLPDIEGVLWLDATTAELRFIEFRYTRLPYDVFSDDVGGRIDLERVPGGTWIVRRWYIRMPQVTVTRNRGFDSYRVISVVESGGEVRSITAQR